MDKNLNIGSLFILQIWNCSQAEGNILLFDKKGNVNLLHVTSGMQSLVEQDVFEVINVKNSAAILHSQVLLFMWFCPTS